MKHRDKYKRRRNMLVKSGKHKIHLGNGDFAVLFSFVIIKYTYIKIQNTVTYLRFCFMKKGEEKRGDIYRGLKLWASDYIKPNLYLTLNNKL